MRLPFLSPCKIKLTYARNECYHLVLIVGRGAAVLCSDQCPIYLFIIKLKLAVLVRTLNNKETTFGKNTFQVYFEALASTISYLKPLRGRIYDVYCSPPPGVIQWYEKV